MRVFPLSLTLHDPTHSLFRKQFPQHSCDFINNIPIFLDYNIHVVFVFVYARRSSRCRCNKTKYFRLRSSRNAKLNPITNHRLITHVVNVLRNQIKNTPIQKPKAPNTSIRTPESSTSSTISATSSVSFSRAKATGSLPEPTGTGTKSYSPTVPAVTDRNTHSTEMHPHSAGREPPPWRFRSFTNAPKTTTGTVVPRRSDGRLPFRRRICKPVATSRNGTIIQPQPEQEHSREVVDVLRPVLATLDPCPGAPPQVRRRTPLCRVPSNVVDVALARLSSNHAFDVD